MRLGFSACGVAHAAHVDAGYEAAFRKWLARGGHAGMAYMENHIEKRLDPRLLLPGARSVIVVALNYFPEKLLDPSQLQFAYYAYGKDYHDVMKARLRELAENMGIAGSLISCCDTKPVMERYWAWKAGLGWIGRNNSLIIPKAGSYFFLGELITTAECSDYDSPMESRCGSCTQCLHACPTGALSTEGGLDAGRCLSYLTVENRGEIPPEMRDAMGNTIYGCDRCQQACPHNRFATPTMVEEFKPSDEFMSMTEEDWRRLTVEDYRRLFRGSAVKRAKFEGLTRNINV